MAKQCKYEKSLRALVENVQAVIRWLDAEMVKPSDVNRGRRIAKVTNALEMEIDKIRYFTLGVDYRTDNKRKVGSATSASDAKRADTTRRSEAP